MSKVVIQIEDLWKEYRLGVIGHGTLTRDLQSWWAKVRGKEDPNSKIAPMLAGQEKQIEGDRFWALRGINLEVKEGEILGIIGKNGAGKSTLLKLLSRVTAPTKGQIKIKGRIASLLEVGTGFHPELTGRENIFMNGAILGMSKQEIRSKLDEIIDFSGVEKFIDTPVKRYSSGMYVRLAFAVAAHLEPEILVVDEVLAVGDAEFQKKCLGKMGEVSRTGRTVLFVSHNMGAVEQLCSRGILLSNGQMLCDMDTAAAVIFYNKILQVNLSKRNAYLINEKAIHESISCGIKIIDIQFFNISKEPLKEFQTGDGLIISILYESVSLFHSPSFRVQIKSHVGGELVKLNNMPVSGYPIKSIYGSGYIDLIIDTLPFTAGDYYFTIGIGRERREWVVRLDDVAVLTVSTKDVYGSGMALDNTRGIFVLPHRWYHSPAVCTLQKKICGNGTVNTRDNGFISQASPVVIGGSGRCGTTLMRVMIDSHQKFCAGPETWLFTHREIDIPALAEKFDISEGDIKNITDKTSSRGEFIDMFFSEYCKRCGKPRWAEKTPANIEHIDFIFKTFPKAKFIEMIRDGRDVICSLRTHPKNKIVDGELVPLKTWHPIKSCISRWLKAIEQSRPYWDHPQYMRVRYEDLINETETTLRKVCDFIGEDFDPAMLQYYNIKNNSRDIMKFPQNPTAINPLYNSAVGRWKIDFSDEDKKIFKDVAGDFIKIFGYETGDSW